MDHSPPPFPSAPPKKRLPPLAWAGIGCGGLVLIAGIGFAIFATKMGMGIARKLAEDPAKPAAKAVIGMHPGIETVSEDAGTGKIVLRVKESGVEVATSYDDIVWGKSSILDTAGNPVLLFSGDAAKIPAWVPRYPAATGETPVSHLDLADRIEGAIAATTGDPVDDVKTFFEKESAKLGSSSSSRSSGEINGMRFLKLHYSAGKRELTVNAYGKAGSPLTVQTIYMEMK